MITPSLKNGCTIAVFNVSDRPAKITKKELSAGVRFLEDMGFKIKIYKESFNKGISSEMVADQLHGMFKDKTISGIIFSSGGAQALGLLKLLDYEVITNNPKLIIGYSDCTHVLQAITQKCNFVTFQGPVVKNIVEWSKKTQNSFIKFTVEKQPLTYLLNKKAQIFNNGQARGESFAGNDICNLATITTLKLDNFKNKILFIENHTDSDPDMVEYWFSWYAALGILNQIKGVVFGNYVMKNKKATLEKLYNTYLAGLNVPVASVDFFGEGENRFIPNGTKAFLDLKNKKISFYF